MAELLYFVSGAFVATVVWFFVWRNNKKKFVDALNKANKILPGEK